MDNNSKPTPADAAYAAAYCDPKRFPLTTQKGLNLKDQKMIDAINRDDIRRMVEEGRPLDANLQARQKEYEEKAKLVH
jgi:hypothetical protein